MNAQIRREQTTPSHRPSASSPANNTATAPVSSSLRIRLLAFAFALAAPLLFPSCGDNDGYGKPPGAPAIFGNPNPNLPRHEFPFDRSGRYHTEWVSAGSGSGGGQSSSPGSNSPKTYSSPPSSSAKRHVVRSGDTLSAISRRYSASVSTIKKTNGLTSDLIRTGQILRIP